MIYTEKQLSLMRKWQKGELKRINILEGSVSSGKTWISLVLWSFWVKTMPKAEDDLYLMSARSLTTLKRNCLLPLQSLVGKKNFTFSITQKEGWLFGRHILLEGANNVQSEAKIRGLTLQGAYCDEVTKLPEDFFSMLLSRLRKPGAKLFGTTNPDAPGHWLKVKYLDREADLDILIDKFLLGDNTKLPGEYIENITREYTGVFYQRFILGEWVLAEGIIYPMFQDAICDAPERSEKARYAISVDYGTQNAFAALLWMEKEGVWYAISEYYHSGRDTGRQKDDSEYAADIDKWLEDCWYELPVNDEGEHQKPPRLDTIIDPSAASFIALLQKRQHRYKVIKADNDVLDGIRETATAMKTGKIKICRDCKMLIRELGGYVWDEKADADKPVKVADHACDAMRYFVKTKKVAVIKRPYEPFIYGGER